MASVIKTKQSIQSLFCQLANTTKDGISRIVHCSEMTGKYARIYQKNGGLLRNFENKYKVVKMKEDGSYHYAGWKDGTPDKTEKERIMRDFNRYINMNKIVIKKDCKSKKHLLVKLCGLTELKKIDTSRPIRLDIRKSLKSLPCVHCGLSQSIVIDHKNDLYNDPRVLNSKTQVVSDFQPLCNACNLQKRQHAKEMRRTGKRIPATLISPIVSAMCSVIGKKIDFVKGDDSFDPKDPDATIGYYWHDPIYFISELTRLALDTTSSKSPLSS